MGLIVVGFVIGLILGAGVSVPMSGRACAGALGTLGAINLLPILAFWLAVRSRTHKLLKPSYDALQVPPTHEGLRVIDERFVDAAHHHGLKVHVWTIDEPLEMRRLKALGVDGIMTDRPEVLLHTLDGV